MSEETLKEVTGDGQQTWHSFCPPMGLRFTCPHFCLGSKFYKTPLRFVSDSNFEFQKLFHLTLL